MSEVQNKWVYLANKKRQCSICFAWEEYYLFGLRLSLIEVKESI